VKTDRVPLEIQVTLGEPFMVESGDADKRALAGGYIAVPELGQVDAVEGEVGGTTGLAMQVGSSKAEDLAGSGQRSKKSEGWR
jgi:hypothetical protein